ncbi:MAG: condensation domain-containing protein, partial [Bryobacteraceae bacterium]
VLRLPSSLQRPEIVLPRGESISLKFEPGLLTEVKRAAREHQVTEYSFLLACYQILLHAYTGQDDIVVGTSASARDNPRWANVVGYFVNILPMRCDLSGSPSFAEHLAHTRDTVLGAMSHQEFPFSLMVSRLRLRRRPDRSPVFQTFFNFLTDRVGELGSLFLGVRDSSVEFGGSVLRPWMVVPQQEGQSEIVLQLSDVGGRLGGNLNYNSDVVDRKTAEAMAEDFREIVEAAAREVDAPIASLLPGSRRSAAEREEIVL